MLWGVIRANSASDPTPRACMRKILLLMTAAAGAVVVGVAAILVLGFVVSLLVAEPRSPGGRQGGVTLSDGHVAVVACGKRGLGKAEILSGNSFDGSRVWRATRSTGRSQGGPIQPLVAVAPHAPGFTIDARGLPPRPWSVLLGVRTRRCIGPATHRSLHNLPTS
jgi:hypothetical protein